MRWFHTEQRPPCRFTVRRNNRMICPCGTNPRPALWNNHKEYRGYVRFFSLFFPIFLTTSMDLFKVEDHESWRGRACHQSDWRNGYWEYTGNSVAVSSSLLHNSNTISIAVVNFVTAQNSDLNWLVGVDVSNSSLGWTSGWHRSAWKGPYSLRLVSSVMNNDAKCLWDESGGEMVRRVYKTWLTCQSFDSFASRYPPPSFSRPVRCVREGLAIVWATAHGYLLRWFPPRWPCGKASASRAPELCSIPLFLRGFFLGQN